MAGVGRALIGRLAGPTLAHTVPRQLYLPRDTWWYLVYIRQKHSILSESILCRSIKNNNAGRSQSLWLTSIQGLLRFIP